MKNLHPYRFGLGLRARTIIGWKTFEGLICSRAIRLEGGVIGESLLPIVVTSPEKNDGIYYVLRSKDSHESKWIPEERIQAL
jgi:hypothetical protein